MNSIHRAGLFARNWHIGNGVVGARGLALTTIFAFVGVDMRAAIFKRNSAKFARLLARTGQATLARFGNQVTRLYATLAGNIHNGKRHFGHRFAQQGLFGIFVE